LGYFYYKAHKNYKTTKAKLDELTQESALSSGDLNVQLKELKAQNDKLTKENEQLKKEKIVWEKDKETLVASVNDKTTKMAKAKAYNDTLNYIVDLISVHNGLSGITEAEYQKGRQIAQTTNDQSFVDLCDWAWQNESINQIERLTAVLKSIATNISSNLQ